MKDKQIFKYTKKLVNYNEFNENKIIVEDLLKSLRHQTYMDLIHKVEILVKDLNTYEKDGPINLDPDIQPKAYYAIHFESLNLSTSNKELNSITIYIGLGLDLNMQKTVLGFWLKKASDNPYRFWLKVCQQLKNSCVDSVELKEQHNQYWLNEAMIQVFGNQY